MYIERNGERIELTSKELYQAYIEQKQMFSCKDAIDALADFAGIDREFVFCCVSGVVSVDGIVVNERFATQLEDFKDNFGFEFEDVINEESPFYAVDKIVEWFDENFDANESEYDMWQWACKGVLCDMAHEIKNVIQMGQELNNLKAFVEEKGWKVKECNVGLEEVAGWELCKCTPVGEKFSFSIEHGGDIQKIWPAIWNYYDCFDVDDCIERLVDARKNGLLDITLPVRELVVVAEYIKDDMLGALSDDVSIWVHDNCGKSVDDIVAEAKQIAEEANLGDICKNDVEKGLD